MKIDGLDWMDWLHKTRAESEEERKRAGISRLDWLKRIEAEAAVIQKEIDLLTANQARDRKSET